jgi:hypothetical protein
MRIVAQQLRLQDAVAAVTRAEARNDDGDALASRLAPDATLTSWNDGELVCARLSARAYGAAAALMPLELSATSCAHGGGM